MGISSPTSFLLACLLRCRALRLQQLELVALPAAAGRLPQARLARCSVRAAVSAVVRGRRRRNPLPDRLLLLLLRHERTQLPADGRAPAAGPRRSLSGAVRAALRQLSVLATLLVCGASPRAWALLSALHGVRA